MTIRDFEVASEKLISFLQSKSYGSPTFETWTSVGNRSLYNLTIAHSNANRQLDFSFAPNAGTHAPYSFSIQIAGDDSKTLDIDQLNKRDRLGLCMSGEDSASNDSVVLETFIESFIKVLSGPLEDVMSGKDWIDLPYDWEPYR